MSYFSMMDMWEIALSPIERTDFNGTVRFEISNCIVNNNRKESGIS